MSSPPRFVVAHPVRPEQINAAGALLGRCFEEELWTGYLADALDNPDSRRRFVRETSINDMRAYAQRASAYIVEGWQASDLPPATSGYTNALAGGILFDTDGAFTEAEHAAHWQKSLQLGYKMLTADEVQLVKSRMALLESVENCSWCAQRYPEGYAYVCMVGVNPRFSGRGVLSALFASVIEIANKAEKPLCLECYAERLVGIYQHQGFELIETQKYEVVPLTQYRMVKLPD